MNSQQVECYFYQRRHEHFQVNSGVQNSTNDTILRLLEFQCAKLLKYRTEGDKKKISQLKKKNEIAIEIYE
jgi:hypothetical protein